MTTICISAKDMKIYADKCVTITNISTDIFLSSSSGNVTDQMEVDKIMPTDVQVVTGTGNFQDVINVYNWIASEKDLPAPLGKTHVYVVQKVGDTMRMIKYWSVEMDNSSLFQRIKHVFNPKQKYRWKTEIRNLNENEVIFDGSGGEYAMGAYKTGKSISDAIRVASQCDTMTNDHVNCFDLNKWAFE